MATLNIEENLSRATDFDEPLLKPTDLDYLGSLPALDREHAYAVLAGLTDGSRFKEFKAMFGSSLVTGFGLVEGRLTGFLVNCGPLEAADGQKGAHFAFLCDSRDVPLVFLQNGGNSINAECDAKALKERAKFAQAQSAARVPKVSINVGGVHADELFTMCGPAFEPAFYFSWPGARMTKSDPELLKALARQKAELKQGKQLPDFEHEIGHCSAQYWASRNVNDGVVLPRDTRGVLAECLKLAMLNHARPADKGKLVLRM